MLPVMFPKNVGRMSPLPVMFPAAAAETVEEVHAPEATTEEHVTDAPAAEETATEENA